MFKNMKLGTKLQSIFLIVSLMGLMVAILGIYNMFKINEKAEQIYKRELMGVTYIKEANINLIYIGRARANYMLANSEEERVKFKESIIEYEKNLRTNIDEAKKLFRSDKAKALFVQYEQMYDIYTHDVDEIINLTSKEELVKRSENMTKLIIDARAKASTLDNILTDLTEIKQMRAKEAYDETIQLYENSRLLMILLVVSSTSIGIMFGVMMTRSVKKQLGGEPAYATEIAKKIAEGDLTIKVVTNPNDKESLLFAMKEMQANLATIVDQVKTGADTISTASKEIANGNMDLSHRTEEQASALEETASSMEEITATIKQTANHTSEASKLAKSVEVSAKNSGVEVNNVLATINEIQSSSNQMVEIISVVEAIAFQTNILALNAAVEAARAGEQGRGFAVVASEVRSLAYKSADASKQIKELISTSVEKVKLGTEQAHKAGESTAGVIRSIEKVNMLIHDMNSANQEQSEGIAQINDAVMQMDTVTQQNAALVEEAAAASHSLQEQASILSQLISIFNTGNETTIRPKREEFKIIENKTKSKPALKIENTKKIKTNNKPVSSFKPSKEVDAQWEEF